MLENNYVARGLSKMKKFKTLSSEGPIFPKKYQSKGYTFKNEVLPKMAEEMLWKLAHYVDSDYWKPEIFSNIKTCLYPELTKNQQRAEFPKDFLPLLAEMKNAREEEKLVKKNRSKEEKLKEKEEKEALKQKHGFATVDGEQVAVNGYLIEDSNWILTRGKDPRKFMWKYPVFPEDVVLNIVNAKPPAGWKGKVESNPNAVWIYKYKQLCGRGPKASFLNKTVSISKNTAIGKEMTAAKYDKAQDVLLSWKKIEKYLDATLKLDDPEIQESAVIAYLIAQTGIRIGNERNLQLQADTRGMSTLQVENITFK